MLRACKRLLRRGGRLAFFTIFVAPALSGAEHRRAVAAGPPEPGGPELCGLLERAGFDDVREHDLTAAYLDTARAWLAARLRHRDDLRPPDPAAFDERIESGRVAVGAIEEGLLKRSLFVATRP